MFLGTKSRTGRCFDYFSHEHSLSENALSEVQEGFCISSNSISTLLVCFIYILQKQRNSPYFFFLKEIELILFGAMV